MGVCLSSVIGTDAVLEVLGVETVADELVEGLLLEVRVMPPSGVLAELEETLAPKSGVAVLLIAGAVADVCRTVRIGI